MGTGEPGATRRDNRTHVAVADIEGLGDCSLDLVGRAGARLLSVSRIGNKGKKKPMTLAPGAHVW